MKTFQAFALFCEFIKIDSSGASDSLIGVLPPLVEAEPPPDDANAMELPIAAYIRIQVHQTAEQPISLIVQLDLDSKPVTRLEISAETIAAELRIAAEKKLEWGTIISRIQTSPMRLPIQPHVFSINVAAGDERIEAGIFEVRIKDRQFGSGGAVQTS